MNMNYNKNKHHGEVDALQELQPNIVIDIEEVWGEFNVDTSAITEYMLELGMSEEDILSTTIIFVKDLSNGKVPKKIKSMRILAYYDRVKKAVIVPVVYRQSHPDDELNRVPEDQLSNSIAHELNHRAYHTAALKLPLQKKSVREHAEEMLLIATGASTIGTYAGVETLTNNNLLSSIAASAIAVAGITRVIKNEAKVHARNRDKYSPEEEACIQAGDANTHVFVRLSD